MPDPYRVGLLGHGTVGSAFEALLRERADDVGETVGLRPEIAGVLTRSRGRFEDVLERSQLVVELIGGVEPAREYVEAKVRTADEVLGPGKRLLIEPGRSLVANSTVTVYTVESVKRGLSTYVAVDGGMSDNLRPMLYGSVYEAAIADRLAPGGELCHVAGKHCESGDVIVHDVHLHDPRQGDVLVTPVTGAYGHAMANNYNGVPRPPVVFCSGGGARLVVRRETHEDLYVRDV